MANSDRGRGVLANSDRGRGCWPTPTGGRGCWPTPTQVRPNVIKPLFCKVIITMTLDPSDYYKPTVDALLAEGKHDKCVAMTLFYAGVDRAIHQLQKIIQQDASGNCC